MKLWFAMGRQSAMVAKPPWRCSLDFKIFTITEHRRTKLQLFDLSKARNLGAARNTPIVMLLLGEVELSMIVVCSKGHILIV